MQGVQAFKPQAKASIDLESFVAEDHFLRRINCILDLSLHPGVDRSALRSREGPTQFSELGANWIGDLILCPRLTILRDKNEITRRVIVRLRPILDCSLDHIAPEHR